MICWHRHPSPIGEILLTGEGGSLTGLYTPGHANASQMPAGPHDPAAFARACAQLDGYFAGTLRSFDLKLRPRGTPFQQRIWEYLQTIPFGQTRTYLDIAKALGSPAAVRAVGAANGANPISIVIPCHRVIASDGNLQGYAGGMPTKQWLLDHEAQHLGT